MFDTLQERLSAAFSSLRGKGRLTEADIDATTREIRIALLEADVNLSVVKQFVGDIKTRAREVELSKALNPSQQIIKIVNEELINILGGETRTIRFSKYPPTVIMLAGLQGAGKTTLAGKLGQWLRDQGHAPLLVAADLQRPNAVQQLQVVGERAGVHVYAPQPGNGIGDPVQVARASIMHAQQKFYDVVVIDTAGRLGVDEEMMAQARNIKAATQPHETLFVVDAMIGQDAVNTALAFDGGVGVDGVVLTKLDGDARGGAALSIARVLGKPIMFASNGESLKDFDVFHPDRMASRILGMGDILTLIEQAERTFDAEESRKTAEKLMRGRNEFTLDDFLKQMQQVRKMGPLSKVFGMLPGMTGQMKEQVDNLDERRIDRVEAIIYSMTPAERADVAILNGSRRARIAKGSGVTVKEVNDLVNQFVEARKMMQQMSGQMLGGAMGAMGGQRRGKQQLSKKAKAKGRSAKPVPARRAEPEPQDQPVAEVADFSDDMFDNLADQAGLGGFELPPDVARMFEQQKNTGPRF